MADLELNISEALAMLGKLTDEASQQSTIHASRSPALAPSSAGRDFVDRGAAFAEVLQQIHDKGARRLALIQETSNQATAQISTYQEGEQVHRARIEAVPL